MDELAAIEEKIHKTKTEEELIEAIKMLATNVTEKEIFHTLCSKLGHAVMEHHCLMKNILVALPNTDLMQDWKILLNNVKVMLSAFHEMHLGRDDAANDAPLAQKPEQACHPYHEPNA